MSEPLADQLDMKTGQSTDLPLPTDKRIRLCAALAELPEFLDSSSRKAFVAITLPHLAQVIIYDGSSEVFVSTLISLAERSGSIPKDQEFHCLGAILYYLLAFKHISNDVKLLCANLILEYELVRNQSFLGELRIQYPPSEIFGVERSGGNSLVHFSNEQNIHPQRQTMVQQVAQVLANVPLGPSAIVTIETRQSTLRSISIKVDEE